MSDNKSRRDVAMGQLTASPVQQQITTGATIVGGQPPARKHVRVNVPVGVERVLYTAATDPEFKVALLRDRHAAARARGLRLRPSEEAMLRLAPAAQLEGAIARLDTSPRNVQRRTFMAAVAASAAAMAAAACGDDTAPVDSRINVDAGVPVDAPGYTPDAGVRDSLPQDVPVKYVDAGVAVDVPTVYPDAGVPPDTVPQDVPVSYPDMGILPDKGPDS